jgi:hypothetical protein
MVMFALGGSDCEALHAGWLGQPANALSSLAYVAAAAYVWRRRGPMGPAVALAAVGVGSVLYHGPMPPGAEAAHDGSLVALAAAMALAGWQRRPLPRPPVAAVVALAVAIGANALTRTGAPLCSPDTLVQGHAAWHALTAAAAALWVAAWPGRSRPLRPVRLMRRARHDPTAPPVEPAGRQ